MLCHGLGMPFLFYGKAKNNKKSLFHSFMARGSKLRKIQEMGKE